MKLAFNRNTIQAMITGGSAGAVLSCAIPADIGGPAAPALCAALMAVVNGCIQSTAQTTQISGNSPSPF